MVRVVRWAQVLFRPIFAFPTSRSASGDGLVACWKNFFVVLACMPLGGIAQLVERLVRNEKARGSNPLTSSLHSCRRGERRLSRRSLGGGCFLCVVNRFFDRGKNACSVRE